MMMFRVFWVIGLLLLSGCALSPTAERHRQTTVDYPLPQAGVLFSGKYVPEATGFIREHRIYDSKQDGNLVAALNAPFEIEPAPECVGRSRKGIILVHGLTDSPFVLRDLAQQFAQKCYLARAVLSPGHGTKPGDLLGVSWRDWVEAVRRGVESFQNQVDELVVLGYSTGGALALYHAITHNPGNIKALVLISPAIRAKVSLGGIANWHKVYSWGIERGKWVKIRGDHDPVKYESFPHHAGGQLHQLIRALHRQMDDRTPIEIPVFMVLTADDRTVSAGRALSFFCESTRADRRVLLWYRGRKVRKTDCSGIEERPGAVPEFNVVNYSHLAFPVSPNNSHYGSGPESYRICTHYPGARNRKEFRYCKHDFPGVDVQYGETSLFGNNRGYILRRLTFNPDFDYMVARIFAFLDS